MRTWGTLPPEEQSTRSTPSDPTALARSTESSTVHPPSTQSVDEMRRNSGYFSGQTFLTAVITSESRRMRLAKAPPYWSERRLLSGERKECNRYPCAAWISTSCAPAASARLAAAAKASTRE